MWIKNLDSHGKNKQKVTVKITNLTTGESYTGRLPITGNQQIYLPVEIQQMLKESGKISPSSRLYELSEA